jgi:glyoxylase-like metal-dependent hydrolase (beta-lactamase superfamily II)
MKTHTALLGTLLAIGLIVPASQAQQKESPPVRLTMIATNLYALLDGSGARGGAFVGDTAVLLIDAKMDQKSVNQTIAEVKKITDKPIKYLVNTHSDGDHVRGNQFFPATVTFIAHENCRKDFFLAGRDGAASEWNKPELLQFVPGVTFRDRMDLYLGPKKIELWYFGVGHTTGDIVVFFPAEKTAFIGDQAFVTRPQLIHSYKGGNSFEHVKTLTKMLNTLEADRFYSGHEEVLDRAAIRKHIDEMTATQEKVKALAAQGKTLADLKGQFKEGEARLIEAIYQEVAKAPPR